MKHEAMSDFEINKAVAVKQGNVVHDAMLPSGNKIVVMRKTYESDVCRMPLNDYCNDPAAMWPIMIENEINVRWPDDGSKGDATKYTDGKLIKHSRFEDKSDALRAAAIVYLMMDDNA